MRFARREYLRHNVDNVCAAGQSQTKKLKKDREPHKDPSRGPITAGRAVFLNRDGGKLP